MKKLKMISYIILAFTFILHTTACNRSAPAADIVVTTEKVIVPEPTAVLMSAEEKAESLYNLLMENKPLWEKEDMISGTLIDLNYDGEPEFVLMHNGYSPDMTIYKCGGETVQEIKTIENIYSDKGVFSEFKVIIPYTDENGVKRWIIPYVTYYDSYYDYHLNAFDFSANNIGETVKFSSRIYSNGEYSRDGYYSYPYLNAEFYIDGVIHIASQDKLNAFTVELDRLINEYEEREANGEMGYLPWGCGGFYPNPSQSEWEDIKMAFLNDLLAAEPAYNLFPDIESDYIYYMVEGGWHLEGNIKASLKKLSDAYYGEMKDYFRTYDLFYDNGGAMCKPVIYLYPVEPTDISVCVEFPTGGQFTCTYPDYGNGWNVTAHPDGTVINKADGLEYSYLYWEGEGNGNWDFSSGFVVKGSDTATFLREKLAYLGLTPREYNEFIVYWLPIMQNNNYNLITFQTTAYEESTRLHVLPEPDSVLRVFMAYMPLEKAVYMPEQKLDRFERTGFSVIEWGGTRVD